MLAVCLAVITCILVVSISDVICVDSPVVKATVVLPPGTEVAKISTAGVLSMLSTVVVEFVRAVVS